MKYSPKQINPCGTLGFNDCVWKVMIWREEWSWYGGSHYNTIFISKMLTIDNIPITTTSRERHNVANNRQLNHQLNSLSRPTSIKISTLGISCLCERNHRKSSVKISNISPTIVAVRIAFSNADFPVVTIQAARMLRVHHTLGCVT